MTGKPDGALGLLIARLFPRPDAARRPYDPLEEVRRMALGLERRQEEAGQDRAQLEEVKHEQ